MLTISHSAVDGTLIDGTSRGDGSGEVLRAHGWRWFRSIAMWGMRGSRDRAPRVRLIEMTADALLAQGFEVEISIDATARPAVEVEADRIEPQAERVAALEQKAERRSVRAKQAWKAEHRAVEALPPGESRSRSVIIPNSAIVEHSIRRTGGSVRQFPPRMMHGKRNDVQSPQLRLQRLATALRR